MFTRVELGNETARHTLLAALLKNGHSKTWMVENIVIVYNRKWNCSLGLLSSPLHYTQNKDDRVDSIYARPRKHSGKTFNRKFPLEKETGVRCLLEGHDATE